jgi:hypothetical protein
MSSDPNVEREESAQRDRERLLEQVVAALAPTSEGERAELERAVLAGAASPSAEEEADERVRLGRAALALALERSFPEKAEAASDDAVAAAIEAELKRLPLAQRIAVLALWRGIPAEEAAVLLAVPPSGVRRLGDLGLDELRRSLARRGLVWDSPAAGAPPEARSAVPDPQWLADLESASTPAKRLTLLEAPLRSPAGAARLAVVARIARLAGVPLGVRLHGEARDEERPEAFPLRVWSAVVVVGALALFVLAGGWSNSRPTFSAAQTEVEVLPLPVSPEGSQPSPPLHFHWKPSRTDVDFAQVILYRQSFERFWESAPTAGDEVTVPVEAYDGVGAGETCYWRVREVADGKPRGSSAFVKFDFAVDSKGYGPGEAPPPELFLD